MVKIKSKIFLYIAVIAIFTLLIAIFNLDKIRSKARVAIPSDIRILIKEKFFGKKFIQELAYFRMSNYNQKILPATQFEYLNIEEYQIDYFKGNKRFFIEPLNENILAINSNFNITLLSSKDFKIQKQISHNLQNLKFFEVLDFKISNKEIFTLGRQFKDAENKCAYLVIYNGKIEEDSEIVFSKFFESQECAISNKSAKIEISNYNNSDGLMIVTGANEAHGLSIEEKDRAQRNDSIFGKVLFLDASSKKISQLAKGIRFPKSIYKYDNNYFFTDGYNNNGDELNKLEVGANYGWPIVTIGEDDNAQNVLEKQNNFKYKKNHESLNFKEPLISFVPSILINSFYKVPENFSEYWKNNFLISAGSLLYRVKLNKDFTKVLFYEKIVAQKSMGDISYIKDYNFVVVASHGSLIKISKR